ncbi:MAG: hypothetical protein IKU17_06565, partial [Clostridia bacterium]|nr:hypothetical protein [Clostridia bacterium]
MGSLLIMAQHIVPRQQNSPLQNHQKNRRFLYTFLLLSLPKPCTQGQKCGRICVAGLISNSFYYGISTVIWFPPPFFSEDIFPLLGYLFPAFGAMVFIFCILHKNGVKNLAATFRSAGGVDYWLEYKAVKNLNL